MGLIGIAILLGIVEGLTEFLPVSSTGHLIVAGHLLGFRGETAETFEIFIQLGAILAVVVVERRVFLDLLRPRGCGLLLVTTAPALVAGALVHDWIKDNLFGPGTVACALFAGGLVILAVERFHSLRTTTSVDDLGFRQALVSGLERRTAATDSFVAAVPVMAAATLYDLMKSWSHLGAADIAPFAIGFVVAFVAAYAAMRTFVAFLGRYTLRPFAWYRIAIAPVIYFLVK